MAGTYLEIPPPGGGGGSGTITGGSNLGAGDGVFSSAVGPTLQFKSLLAGTNITLVPTATDITINATGGGGFITAISDTNSVDLTVGGTTLSADVKISAAAATAGFFKATTTIKVDGLHVEAPEATTALTGFITSADWNTFNNKEPAITAATTADYYRGDKTFQPLNTAAMTAVISGTAAAAGKVGEVLTASTVANTVTGVGLTGVYGNAVSLSLTAGSWEVWGVAGFNENGATLTTALECGVSDSSSGVGINILDTSITPALISSTSDCLLTAPHVMVDLAATTTYYLNTKFYYTAGTPMHRGKIIARRVR